MRPRAHAGNELTFGDRRSVRHCTFCWLAPRPCMGPKHTATDAARSPQCQHCVMQEVHRRPQSSPRTTAMSTTKRAASNCQYRCGSTRRCAPRAQRRCALPRACAARRPGCLPAPDAPAGAEAAARRVAGVGGAGRAHGKHCAARLRQRAVLARPCARRFPLPAALQRRPRVGLGRVTVLGLRQGNCRAELVCG